MKKRLRVGRLLIVLLILIVIVLLIPFSGGSLLSKFLVLVTGSTVGIDEFSNKGVATVNDEVITLGEIDEMYERLPDVYKVYISKEFLLNETIKRKVLLQETIKENIIVSEEEIEESIESIKEEVEDFDEVLELQGYSLEEFKEKVREDLMIKKLLDNLGEVEVNEEEIRDFYKSGKEELNETYENVKDQIKEFLEEQKKIKLMQDYINGLMSKAKIEIFEKL